MKISIYDTICQSSNESGRLPQHFQLPQKETAPNKISFMAGAMDGIGIFHATPKKPEPEKVIAEIAARLKSGKTDKIAALIEKHGVIQLIDPLLTAIRENASAFNAVKIVQYAEALAFGSETEELVKFGIALLGLFDWSNTPEMQGKLITLGLYEEFTLYVLVAASGWDNSNEVVFKIAQNVDGWGKIHAVERLESITDEIRDWILRNGCSNAVMDAYLGLECANKGNLVEALRRESIDAELFESVGIIVDALIDEGPVNGISEYEHAKEVLLRYLRFAEHHANTLVHLWRILNLQNSLDEHEFSNKDELLRLCNEISGRPIWREMIQSTLSDPQDKNFFYANHAAGRLNIDVTNFVFAAIKQDPIKNSGYLSKVCKNPEYAKELILLYEEVLPLDQMASGMGDYLFSPTFNQECGCLDFMLQELGAYPLLGENLVRTGLLSPVTRNRNMSCKAIEAWNEALGQPLKEMSPSLYAVVKRVASAEVNSDTKKRLKTLLR